MNLIPGSLIQTTPPWKDSKELGQSDHGASKVVDARPIDAHNVKHWGNRSDFTPEHNHLASTMHLLTHEYKQARLRALEGAAKTSAPCLRRYGPLGGEHNAKRGQNDRTTSPARQTILEEGRETLCSLWEVTHDEGHSTLTGRTI